MITDHDWGTTAEFLTPMATDQPLGQRQGLVAKA